MRKGLDVYKRQVVSVFDVSQTEGREIPNIAVNMLTGDCLLYTSRCV